MVKYADPIPPAPLSECFFYHKMDLPGIGVVGGSWDLRGRFDDYINHAPLAGKSVLDLGTAAGFLSFEAEKRGAHVVSFDMDHKGRQHYLPYKGHICYEDKPAYDASLNVGYQRWKNGYWRAHHAFGSKARVYYGDIYHLPLELGRFDVAIAGCIMMHLQNPILALESISRLSVDKIIVVDTVNTDVEDRIAHLESTADNPAGHFIWWVYSIGLYREVFAMLGYELVSSAQNFYICNDYSDGEGRPDSREVRLTTLTAERRR
jgi:SAM-dependent methyltransferase